MAALHHWYGEDATLDDLRPTAQRARYQWSQRDSDGYTLYDHVYQDQVQNSYQLEEPRADVYGPGSLAGMWSAQPSITPYPGGETITLAQKFF
jgi:hypothetical protein